MQHALLLFLTLLFSCCENHCMLSRKIIIFMPICLASPLAFIAIWGHGPYLSLVQQIDNCATAPDQHLNQCWLISWTLRHPPERMAVEMVLPSNQHNAFEIDTFIALKPRQNCGLFAEDIFKCIFLKGNVWISIKYLLKSVPRGYINSISALIQIMAFRRPGDKPLLEPMMVSLLTHISVTRTQFEPKPHPTWEDLKDCICSQMERLRIPYNVIPKQDVSDILQCCGFICYLHLTCRFHLFHHE